MSFIFLISTGRVCYLLVDPVGPFADCHKEISYAEYYKKCIQDGCRCEGCLCNVIAGYAKACAAKDIDVNGWRNSVKPCAQGELNNDFAIISRYLPFFDFYFIANFRLLSFCHKSHNANGIRGAVI